jgi:hypothetical protein
MSSNDQPFHVINPLPNVKLKNSLENFVSQNTLVKQIVDFVKLNFENYDSLKYDLEFLEYILTLIKNVIKTKKQKNEIDKKEIIIKIFQTLYGRLEDNDKKALTNHVDYLINNKIIKKLKYYKKIIKYVKKNFLPNII